MRHNFHTHTARCLHAVGSDEEYVIRAIEAGFDKIGFADHSPWPYDSFVSTIRMKENELEGYVNSVLDMKEKYKDKIEILLGLECEYFRPYIPWLCTMIEKYGMDYVILGHHFTPDEQHGVYNGFVNTPEKINAYKDDVIEAMNSGLFAYIAHPDLFMRKYGDFDSECAKVSEQIIITAIETDTPLEYNLLGKIHSLHDGMKGYPHPDFWHIAGEMHAKAIIGIDAHNPLSYLDTELFDSTKRQLNEWGLKVVEDI